MIRRCVYCATPHDMGHVMPLEDLRITHGMCPEAEKIQLARLDAMPGVFFSADDVVKTSPISERLMTTPHHLPPIRPEWPRN